MTQDLDPEGVYRCPDTGERLELKGDALVTPSGKTWHVVRGIPRFVPGDAYVSSFSYEWNAHSQTQLDSATGGTSKSEETLREKTALGPDDVKDRVVLDAGVGAGRFSEVLARWGARAVYGVDLSFAVEAARGNLAKYPNTHVAQGDIRKLPFAPASFDLIISIGVLHHTPGTRESFQKLVPLLKPGGTICIWVYPSTPSYVTRTQWIPYTRTIPAPAFHAFSRWIVPFLRVPSKSRFLQHWKAPFVKWLDDVFPTSNQSLGLENDILDTLDGFSPWYHFTHLPDEVTEWFKAAGLTDVRALEYLTAVRGKRPA